MPEDSKKESNGFFIKIPDKTIIAILIALGGALWNKFDIWATGKDSDNVRSVQSESYEIVREALLKLSYEVQQNKIGTEVCREDVDKLYAVLKKRYPALRDRSNLPEILDLLESMKVHCVELFQM